MNILLELKIIIYKNWKKIRAQNQRLQQNIMKGLSVDACIDSSDLVDVKAEVDISIYNRGDYTE